MTSAVRRAGREAGVGVPSRPILDRPALRALFLVPGGLSLLLGLNAALQLLGVGAPLAVERLAELHAPLMVFGFVGTLIVLERAVAIRRPWAFASPALLSAGSLLLLSPLPDAVGITLVLVGVCILLLIYRVIWRRSPAAATEIQVLGAVAAMLAVLLWLGGAPVASMLPGMAGFVIVTIAGERLELARISPTVTPRVASLGLAAATLLLAAVALAPLWPDPGFLMLGLALALLVVWLFRFDAATHLARTRGLPRYMAVCLLAGYLWLLVAAGIWVFTGEANDGPRYDALVHTIFLGFVMSMIMAHAPVILPAVVRTPLPYRPFMYLPVALLHVSLLVRVLLGDVAGSADAIRIGGVANVVAVLLFAALAVTSAVMGRPTARGGSASATSDAPPVHPTREKGAP